MILGGARQVGKTYTALTFGKDYYTNTAYFNLEEAPVIKAIFDRSLEPTQIIHDLSVVSNKNILPHDTLIIFDEIQACEKALTSLKYFCESTPDYHIIACGSLLGITLNREEYSFPVGKTNRLTLYPLDFEEFLWATGKNKLAEDIRERCVRFSPSPCHEQLMDIYRTYLVVGGMPQAVSEYVSKHDFDFILAAQKNLNDAYIADMAKYASAQETIKIMATWESIPTNLAKENHKFQYKTIKRGARAYDYELPIHWLTLAGIIYKCILTKQGNPPLSAFADNGTFKIYMGDTGLLCSKFGLNPNIIMAREERLNNFKGALTENYVMQALVCNGIKPYYWTSNGKAELDFVFQDRAGNIIPLECKLGESVKSKSLTEFIKKYSVPYSIRVSAKNFGFENNIKSVPLYALFCLGLETIPS